MSIFVRQFRSVAVFTCLASTMAVLSGCESAPEGTVQIGGLVTLDGQPVDNAAVAFAGNNGARLATAQTDKSGKFSIRASLGKNVVTVSKETGGITIPAGTEENMLMPTDAEYKKLPVPKKGVPGKYSDPKTSGLAIDVAEGMSEVELALSSK